MRRAPNFAYDAKEEDLLATMPKKMITLRGIITGRVQLLAAAIPPVHPLTAAKIQTTAIHPGHAFSEQVHAIRHNV